MARIPEEVIEAVKDSVDLVDVIGDYVTLKRSGSSWKGLCPFHEEKTPSFHVFPNSGRYKCFGCGAGGTVFNFLMERTGQGFREVLGDLASRAGIALPEEPQGPADDERRERRAGAAAALRFAEGFYRAVLGRDPGAGARAYLRERGFSEATLATFGIGYAPDRFEGLLDYARNKGFGEQALLDAGLVKRSEQGRLFDMFRGRIMFPIRDLRGETVGFGARALGDAMPKYLNSPDGPLFHKGREMYGLHRARDAARRAGRLIVVEGYTDVMHCHQAGLGEVAAGLGTALTPDNARQLRRFGVPVRLLFDGDEAGLRAAERAAETLLAERVEGSVALLPAGRDPADLVREEGPEALEAVLERATDLWSYRMGAALERHDLSTLEGREHVVRELEEPISRMADPLRRDLALRLLSERLGVPESTLRNRIRPARGRGAPPADHPGGGPELPASWVRAEADFLAASLLDRDFWDRLQPVYPPGAFRDPDYAEIAGALGDLRRGGESWSREGLLGVLVHRDRAVRALEALEVDSGARTRADEHLARIAARLKLEAARAASDPLRAVLEVRRGKAYRDENGEEAR